MIKRLSAHYIFSLKSAPLKFGILTFRDNVLTGITDTGGQMQEIALMEFHSGMIIPAIEGLSIEKIRQQEQINPALSLTEILQQLAPAGCEFKIDQPQSVFLLSGFNPATFRTTPSSKLKKLL